MCTDGWQSWIYLTFILAGRLKDWRFLAALLLGHFVVIPLAIGGFTAQLPRPSVPR